MVTKTCCIQLHAAFCKKALHHFNNKHIFHDYTYIEKETPIILHSSDIDRLSKWEYEPLASFPLKSSLPLTLHAHLHAGWNIIHILLNQLELYQILSLFYQTELIVSSLLFITAYNV